MGHVWDQAEHRRARVDERCHALESNCGRGVLLFELLTFTLPFRQNSTPALLAAVLRGSYVLPTHLSDEARDIVSMLLATEPQERLRIDQVMGHLWVTAEATARAPSIPRPRIPPPERLPKRHTPLPIPPSTPAPSPEPANSPPGSPIDEVAEESSEEMTTPQRQAGFKPRLGGPGSKGFAPLQEEKDPRLPPVKLTKPPKQSKRSKALRPRDTRALLKLGLRAKASKAQQYHSKGVVLGQSNVTPRPISPAVYLTEVSEAPHQRPWVSSRPSIHITLHCDTHPA